MDFVNATKLAADYTMAVDKTGREWLVIVAKGTYGIPQRPDDAPQLQEEQVPLVMVDSFTGEPGLSAPTDEIDFALRKLRCDVLLNGTCYAPGGKPAKHVSVGIRVGSLSKAFNVVGKRVWRSSGLTVAPTAPEAFVTMPISYDNAYGGVEKSDDPRGTQDWYPLNHVGIGYHPGRDGRALDGEPLPNTEEIGQPVSRPDGSYRPMAYGPLGRSWQQRIEWAGTYDQTWKDETFPFLPPDFDDRYFQCAPEDQQTHYLQGREEVVLINLTPEGRTAFRVPVLSEPVSFLYKNGDTKRVAGVVDTLVLEPDKKRFMLSLRTSLPLRRNLHEIRSVVVGRALLQPTAESGEERKVAAKPHYKSLAELMAANRPRG